MKRLILLTSVSALSMANGILSVRAEGAPEPVSQAELNALAAEFPNAAFLHSFEAGDELTEAVFTHLDGAGANVGAGQLFTRLPRADLDGAGEWATHFPEREGGPQAQSCITCHAAPLPNGAGGIALNVAIDPLQTGDPALYLERNTLHLFGLGAVQRVSEEMTQALHALRDTAAEQACAANAPVTVPLEAKGVGFGALTATPSGGAPCVAEIDTAAVQGVDDDLVIRMFGWKGTHATLRSFARGAAHNEMGMQAVELVGDADGDFDGVTGELSVGDLTAMTLYMAGLERPTTLVELADLGLHDLADADRRRIETGEALFAEIGCAGCHVPSLELADPIYREPSAVPGFAEPVLPSGAPAQALGLLAERPLQFNLTTDQPNNRVETDAGLVRLGSFETTEAGGATIRWYSDFKRHDMGPALADPIDAYGFGASTWPTRSLAGVGSTGPWLHNGHATTLEAAILAHGGAAAAAREGYAALGTEARAEIVAFLENLVIVNVDPEEEEG